MYLGHFCKKGLRVVHHYSYQSVQFDENFTSVQFDENHTLEKFDETICSFQTDGNVRLNRWLFHILRFNAKVHGAELGVSCTADLSRPSKAKA